MTSLKLTCKACPIVKYSGMTLSCYLILESLTSHGLGSRYHLFSTVKMIFINYDIIESLAVLVLTLARYFTLMHCLFLHTPKTGKMLIYCVILLIILMLHINQETKLSSCIFPDSET